MKKKGKERMIDKIIEELEKVAKENLGYENSSMTESEMRTYCSLSLFEIKEIVKKHENDGWVLCSERLPEIETTLVNKVNYLICCGADNYLITGYCEGWNCFRDSNGEVSKVNEITSVVAWKELELYKGVDE